MPGRGAGPRRLGRGVLPRPQRLDCLRGLQVQLPRGHEATGAASASPAPRSPARPGACLCVTVLCEQTALAPSVTFVWAAADGAVWGAGGLRAKASETHAVSVSDAAAAQGQLLSPARRPSRP